MVVQSECVRSPGCLQNGNGRVTEALRLLGRLADCYDAHELRHFVPMATRELSVACGDPVRLVREVGHVAREAWLKVAEAEGSDGL